MNLREITRMRGDVAIVLKRNDGTIKDRREIKNLVVNTGLAYIISRMVGTAKSVMSHMGVGAGTTAAAAANTALESQLGSRVSLDSTTIAGSNNEKVVYVATFAAGVGTGAVTEAGVFNAGTSGDMLCRTVFAVVNKAADDTMEITWTITLTAS
jgi:hypothetical protein